MQENKISKICLIILYFGKMPNYFEYWLESCKYNPTINFLIFTDDYTKYNYPNNVKIIYITFEKLKKIIQSKFDFEISLEKPYKLCDYKPAYGYIFSDYLKEFDFWGHCDLDIIFGNIRKFLPKEIKKYDKIFEFGHFSLYKNTNNINKSFMKYKDSISKKFIYIDTFTTNESLFFDEIGKYKNGIISFYNQDKSIKMFKNYNVVADISVVYNNLIVESNKQDGKCIFEFNVENDVSRINAYYLNRKELRVKEYMYLHLQKRNIKIESHYRKNILIIPNKIIDDKFKEKDIKLFNKYCKKVTLIRKKFLIIKFKNLLNKFKYGFK